MLLAHHIRACVALKEADPGHSLNGKCIAWLQVMGAHLSSLRGHEREQEMWREALSMLQRARDLPAGQEQLFASLRISYDALEVDQRRMFLDTAFFFLGRRADTAVHAWMGYGLGHFLVSLFCYGKRYGHFCGYIYFRTVVI